MNLYDIVIEPLGNFGTPLKGDTLFGHFCWQAAYDASLLEGGLERQIANYAERPFAVFSSAYPRIEADDSAYALKRPDLPFHMLFGTKGETKERMLLEKTVKAKKWMRVDKTLTPDLAAVRFLTDKELGMAVAGERAVEAEPRLGEDRLGGLATNYPQPHNTINRLTQTTGTGMFAPFSMESFVYRPGVHLSVFVLIDKEATDIERVRKAMEIIGVFGYGRDASSGLGRFRVIDVSVLRLPRVSTANACYTLGPSVPEVGRYGKFYFTPFVRFGRHGDRLACSGNPFKNPVIMADEGAVLVPKDTKVFEKPYLGKAVGGVSKVQPKAVAQGYAPYLPLRLEQFDGNRT